MAEARQNWLRWFLLGALCLSAHAVIFAQSAASDSGLPEHFVQIQAPQSGSLAGRLTDLHSAPLAGVSIILRSKSTGAEVRATTARNGAFRFASLDAGEYTLDADAVQLGHGRLEGIFVTGGVESRVQAALNFEPVSPTLIEAAAPTQIDAPPIVAAHIPLNVSMPLAPPLAPQAATVASATPPVPLRPALSTSTTQVVASIADEPLHLFPPAILAAANIIRPLPAPEALRASSATRFAPARGAHAICSRRRRCNAQRAACVIRAPSG